MFDQCIFFNLSTLTRQIMKTWQNEFSMIGLSPSHGYLLMAIALEPSATQKDLSEIMELDASTIARFVDGLESKKLIKKTGTGKGTNFVLTKRGLKLTRTIDKMMNDLSVSMRSIFGKREFHNLVSLLQETKLRLI